MPRPVACQGLFPQRGGWFGLWRHGWLRTGDLGYIADGELFLTGRDKNLVVHRRRNLHPEDLEQTVSALQGVHGGRQSSAMQMLCSERNGSSS